MAAATNVSAFNVGITAGPWLGGRALGAGAGVLALGAVALGAVSVRREKVLVP